MPIDVKEFRRKREQLKAIVLKTAETASILEEHGVESDIKQLEELADKLEDDFFRVLVIGEFKNGKSTFINYMLGEPVLPTDTLPCTAIITEIEYASSKSAELYFSEDMPEEISQYISKKVADHIKSSRDSSQVPPMTLRLDEISQCIKIPKELMFTDDDDDDDDDGGISAAKKAIGEFPFTKIVVKYPLEILKDGVKIVDTPGLNESNARTRVTNDYLGSADAVVFLFRQPKILSKTDKEYIKEQRLGDNDIFFAVNAIDDIDDSDKEEFIDTTRKALSRWTRLGSKGVFFVSAKTGECMSDFESALSSYLETDRAKKQLLPAQKGLISCIKGLITSSETYNAALESEDPGGLKERKKAASHSLNEAERAKDNMIARLDEKTRSLYADVRSSMENKYQSILQAIPGEVSRMNTNSRITLAFWNNKEQAEALTREIMDKLRTFFEHEIRKWAETELTDMLQTFLDDLRNELEGDMKRFYEAISRFNYAFTGDMPQADESFFSNMSSIMMGLALGGIGYAAAGGILGYGTINTVLGSILGTVLGSTIFSTIFAGGTIIGIAYAAYKLWNYSDEATNEHKNAVQKACIEELSDKKSEVCNEYAGQLSSQIREQLRVIDNGLEGEVEKNRELLRAIERDIESKAEERRKKVNAIRGQVQNLIARKKEAENVKI